MVSRYDVANLFSEHWPLLSWKGDAHAKGVYFNDEYGYLVERTYAARARHDEAAPSVFYIPDEGEGEVVTGFPYNELTKRTKNYNLLFQEGSLKDAMLNRLFTVTPDLVLVLKAEPLIRLLNQMPNKRQRDRSWLRFTITGDCTEAALIENKKEVPFATERFEITTEMGSNGEAGVFEIAINANSVLHALNLFNTVGNVFFSISHDRIKITSYISTPKVEVVISLPKKSPNAKKSGR